MTGDDIPPARDGEINTIPDLREGDEIRVRTKPTHDPNRNLTVVETDPEEADRLGLQPKTVWRSGHDRYLLEGYGTRYLLTTWGTSDWRSVCLVWKSNRNATPVRCIEVRDGEAEDVLATATDGGRTIVGDPSHPAETADMSELSSDFAEDFGGSPDPHIVPCRQCGAKAGEPCELYGGEDAGEPKGSPHASRGTDARSARGERDE